MNVFLDAGPLGMISNPKSRPENEECRQWLSNLIVHGYRVVVPEITDYEVRRELIRAGKTAGLARLDTVRNSLDFLPINTPAILFAAELWAQVRQARTQTAPDHALDGDVILAAQAITSNSPLSEVVVATTNVGHLSRMLPAKHWRDIVP